MWRTTAEREASAEERLRLALEVWGWEPHAAQRRFFTSGAQVRVAACGRRWGKTEALSLDVASLAIAEARAGRDCRQLIVAPTEAQARLLGDAVAARLQAAFDDGLTAWTDGLALDIRQRPALQITLGPEGADLRAPAPGRTARAAPFTRIVCRTAGRDGAGLRGLWAHRIVVDEAGRVPDHVMTEVLLPMLLDVGGDYVLASSPFGRRSAFYHLFAKGREAEAPAPPSVAPTPPSSGTPPPGDRERGQGQGAESASREGASRGQSASAAPIEAENESTPPPPPAHTAMTCSHWPLSLSEGGGVPDEGGVGATEGGAGARLTFASFQCPTSDNPHNDRAFLESVREEMGDATFAQEIQAEFVDDGGAVFREDDIVGCLETDALVAHVRGDLLSAPRPGRLYSAGIDWGRRQDFTVLAILDATEQPARLVRLQRWTATGWDVQVAAVAATLAEFGPVRVLADGNSIGDPLIGTLTGAVRAAQAGRGHDDPRGVAVERFVFTADSKLQLVDHLTLGLARRGLRYPHHPALLAELRGFEYGASGAGGRARMAARGSGHDDIVMSLALAWWCAPAGAPEPPASRILLGSSLGVGR